MASCCEIMGSGHFNQRRRTAREQHHCNTEHDNDHAGQAQRPEGLAENNTRRTGAEKRHKQRERHHLRAARGRTSRVLVPLPGEFRWEAAGSASPWFEGSAVYRETAEDGWDAALAALRRDLIDGQG